MVFPCQGKILPFKFEGKKNLLDSITAKCYPPQKLNFPVRKMNSSVAKEKAPGYQLFQEFSFK